MHRAWNIARIMLIASALAVLSSAAGARIQPEAGESPPPRELRQRVADLVDDLDADSREVRAAAQQDLLRLGPAALPHLPPPELLPNSVVPTVRKIRLALEEQQARASVRPSRVTLRGEMPLGDALRRVTEQTGNEIDASALSPERLQDPVQTGFQEAPFWAAFDALAERGGFTWEISGETNGIRLGTPDDENAAQPLAVDNSGVYRVAVTSAGLRPVAGRPDERLLRLEVRFTAEPRLRPLFFAFAGRDLQVSSGGQTLPPFSPEAQKEIPFGENGKDVRVTWDFRAAGDAPANTASLTAKATVLTAAGSEAITFDDLAKSVGAARRRGGVTVTLEEVTFGDSGGEGQAVPGAESARDPDDGRTAHVRVAVSYDTGGPAFESHRTWIFHNQAYLKADKETRLPYDAFTTALARDGAVAVEYQFDHLAGDADDYEFVYVAPTLLIKVPVEVKLSGIPVSSPSDRQRSQP